MSKRIGWTCAFPLLAAAMLASCSDTATEQNTITSSLPSQDVAVRETTLVAGSSSSFRQSLVMGGTRNLLGIAGNTSASLLIQYYAGNFPNRDTVAVYRARLTLHPEYHFGQQGGSFGFTVHRIDQSWNPSSFIADSLHAGFYDPTVRGIYSGIAGTDSNSITIDLDTAMVRQWFVTPTSTTTTK